MRRSTPLIAAYRKLYGESQVKHTGQQCMGEILASIRDPDSALPKRGGR